MSDPFLGQIQIVGFNFAPNGWATCDGQILPINQNTALFSLLGTTYGGDGRTNFGLPNLQDRTPFAWAQGPGLSSYSIGETGGSSTTTLNVTQLAAHVHQLVGDTNGATSSSPGSGTMLAAATVPTYAPAANLTPLAPQAMGVTGGGQPHDNRQPYLGVLFVIAMQGIFPARS